VPENQFNISNLVLFQHMEFLGAGQQTSAFSSFWRFQTTFKLTPQLQTLPFSRAVCLSVWCSDDCGHGSVRSLTVWACMLIFWFTSLYFFFQWKMNLN